MREGVCGLEAEEDLIEGRPLIKLPVGIEGGGGEGEGEGRREEVGELRARMRGVWGQGVQVVEKLKEAVCEGWRVLLKGLV